jgi:hypothetical protein
MMEAQSASKTKKILIFMSGRKSEKSGITSVSENTLASQENSAPWISFVG